MVKRFRVYFWINIFILFISFSVSSAKSPKENIASFCKENSDPDLFLKNLNKMVLQSSALRYEFMQTILHDKSSSCLQTIQTITNSIAQGALPSDSGNAQMILVYALAAKMPAANQIIEHEIDLGRLSSWLDVLQSNNIEAYKNALKRWVHKVAIEIRVIDKAELLAEIQYGKVPNVLTEMKAPEVIRIWTPILMNRYLMDCVKNKEKLYGLELNDLNIIYAASTATYRDIFGDSIAKIVAYNSKDWIYSFRKEPTWVQFKLFPILKKVKDGNIKRELIWLVKNHQDEKIRVLSKETLDELAYKK